MAAPSSEGNYSKLTSARDINTGLIKGSEEMDHPTLTSCSKFHSFTSGWPVFPAPLVKGIVFSALYILASFVKDKVSPETHQPGTHAEPAAAEESPGSSLFLNFSRSKAML